MSDDPEQLSPPDLPPPTSAQRMPRTWPQRLMIASVFLFGFGSFGAAGALYAGQRVLEDRNLAPAIIDPSQTEAAVQPPLVTSEVAETGPPATFPPAEPDARNFLITGADNNSCIDPDSPYAPAFGDRSNFGERSDTVMMWRVNPATSQVAVLSFPRDLFVDIAGSSRKGRINEAYERDNPQRLIDTIYQNFGVNTDHFVQVDFCAFRTLVNAVGGVAVPFDTLVRDPNSGLNVTATGCFTFDGDHALAYVRSRKLLYLDDNGEWRQDGTSDLGRISRQQDFIRRTISQLLSKGAFNPDVAGGLIETNSEYVVTDPGLTPRKMLEFAGVMSRVQPGQITSYQITADPTTIQGNSVLVPLLENSTMQGVLALFRGEATLAATPPPTTPSTTDAVDDPAVTVPDTSVSAPTTATSPQVPNGSAPTTTAGSSAPSTVAPDTTLPTVDVDQNPFGIVPDENISC